ncbi:MAG: tetratricopeptide repeat protein [Nitrospirota bacterium]
MFDISLLQENWWLAVAALAAIVAVLALYGVRRKRKVSKRESSAAESNVERERREDLKRDMENIRSEMKTMERRFVDKMDEQTKRLSEQIGLLENALKEKTGELAKLEAAETSRRERWAETLNALFPQMKSLEKLERFRELSLNEEDIRNIVLDVVEKTQISPEAIDLFGEHKKQSFFEKGIMTLLSHRLHDIERELAARAGNETVYVLIGNCQYESGNYLLAKDYYENALKVKPSFARAWYNKSVVLVQSGRHEEALSSVEKTLEMEPLNGMAWLIKGIALGRLDRYEDAMAALSRALECEHHSARIWHTSGVVLARLGRYEEALKAYENALELNPASSDTWYNKGVTLIQLGLQEKALRAFERAIKLNPDSPEAWYNEGIALGRLGRYDEALKAYERSLDLRPDFADAWYNRASLYSLRGDKENALADLSKAVMINPSCRDAAKEDDVFRNLLEDEDFRRVVS